MPRTPDVIFLQNLVAPITGHDGIDMGRRRPALPTSPGAVFGRLWRVTDGAGFAEVLGERPSAAAVARQ